MKQQTTQSMRSVKSLIVGLALATVFGASAFGQNYIGGVNGDWWTDANWFGGSYPWYSDVVVANGNGPEIWDGNAYANTLSVYAGSSVLLNDYGYLYVDNGILLGAASPAPFKGNLTLQDNSYMDSWGALTANYGSSVLLNSSLMYMWNHSMTFNNGSVLRVENGSNIYSIDQLVFNNSSTGSVSASSVYINNELYVGNSSGGNSLTISNGGYVGVSSETTVYVGYTNSNNNTLLVASGGFLEANSDLYVGYADSSFNSMIISNGGMVANNGSGYIGYHPGSSNNSVLVTGSGSSWSNRYTVVGRSEAGNSMTIQDGGYVLSYYGATIGEYTRSSNNVVTVTGSNSVWDVWGNLYVGDYGNNNSMIVSNGGYVYTSGDGYIGYGKSWTNSSGNNNSVTVTGSNSQWNVNGSLTIGYNGSFNQMTIADGGRVNNTKGDVGFNGANNTVLVTGTNSVWNNSGDLIIGDWTTGNQMTITNGGKVAVVGQSYLGYQPGADSNSVVVTGSGSVWTNSNDLVVGQTGFANQMLITASGVVYNVHGFVGYNDISSNNSVLVEGPGSAWINSGNLTIGNTCVNNSMTVSNGGTVFNNYGYIGYSSSANSNSVVVTGEGSQWNNNNELWVGVYGSGNSLSILNSGVVNSATSYIGGHTGSANNSVLVDGTGSRWNINGDLYVGHKWGTFSTLTIANDGYVDVNGDTFIGHYSQSTNNVVLVTGPGSELYNSGDLYVGYRGSFNSMIISNGGEVVNEYGYIGNQSMAGNNSVLVTGSTANEGSSYWDNDYDVYVGNSGANNRLTIANGGHVDVGDYDGGILYIGNNASSSNNSVLVTGYYSEDDTHASSRMHVYGDLYVGNYGVANSMVISNGGYVSSQHGFIGYEESSSNNNVLVTGIGGDGYRSTWQMNGYDLEVGYYGAGNSLVIADGGRVYNNRGYIGDSSSGSNNSVLVTGAGSQWQNSQSLYVGVNGGNNTLTINNGGYVRNNSAYIGWGDFSGNNSVLVTGHNSYWENYSELYVGFGGANNNLTIADGGHVDVNSDDTMYVGFSASSSNNSVLVTGSGEDSDSRLHVYGNLYLGYSGANNSLTVSNGGYVSAYNLIVGANASSIGNVVAVDGSGSELDIWDGEVGTIDIRNGTLFVNNDGSVYGGELFATNGANSVVQLAGGGIWLSSATVSNDSPFVIGDGNQQAYLYLFDGTSSFANDLVVAPNGHLELYTNVTVNISGNFTNKGAVSFSIASTNVHGRINANGTAYIDGDTWIYSEGYTPHHLDKEVLITAAGGVTNVNGTLYVDMAYSPFLDPHLVYNTNDVTLLWSQLSFTNFFGNGLTPNQKATAGGLDSEGTNTNAGVAGLIDYLDYLPTNAIPGALDLIAPDELTAMAELAFAGMDGRGYGFLGRLQDLRGGMHGFNANRLSMYDSSGPGQSAQPVQQMAAQTWAVGSGPLSPSKDNPWGLYLEGNGEFVNVKSDANASGYHLNTAGVTLGLDRRLSDEWVVGLTFGYADITAKLVNDGRVEVDNGRASLYATWFKNGYHLEGMISGGINSYETRRTTIGGIARGTTDGTEFSGLFGGGYDWQKGIWNFGPQVTIQYKRVDIDAFTENGTMSPLTILSQGDESFQSRIGARVGLRKNIGKVIVVPELSLAWQHEYLDDGVSLDSRFANGVGNSFTVRGPKMGTDSAVVGVGVWVQWTERIGTYLNYTTQFGRDNYEPHSVNGGVNVRF